MSQSLLEKLRKIADSHAATAPPPTRTTEGSKILKDLTAKVNRRKEDEAVKVKMREQEEARLKPAHTTSRDGPTGAATGNAAAEAAAGDAPPIPGGAAEDIARKMEEALEKSDAMTSAPVAPPVFQELVVQLPPLPPTSVADLAVVQELLASSQALVPGLALEGHARDAFAQLLQQPGCLLSCPDAATAQAVFQTACCSQDEELAGAAYGALMSWCGLSSLAAADELLILEGPPPGAAGQLPSMHWMPTAADFLSALHAIGCKQPASTHQQQQQNTAGGRGRRTASGSVKGHHEEKENGQRKGTQAVAGGSAAAAAGPGSSSTSNAALSYRDGPLRWLLQALAHMCKLAAAGALAADLGGQPGLELAKLLLQLHLDRRARLTCMCQLQEAFTAVVGVFEEEEWLEVVGPHLVLALAEPMGPSHWAAVKLLQELPGRSVRMQQLRQGAALQLVKHITKRVQQAPTPSSALLSVAPSDLVGLLGSSSDAPNTLRLQLQDPETQQDDYWALLSVVDLADVLLWSYVDAPEGNKLDERVNSWFIRYLKQLEQKLRAVQAHFVKMRLAEVQNNFQFAQQLLLAPGALAAFDEGEEAEEMEADAGME